MRVNTVAVLLLAGLLAACGANEDDSAGMMDNHSSSSMMQDSVQMDDAMGSEMMETAAMRAGSSPMGDAMDDGSMARDTTEMRRP